MENSITYSKIQLTHFLQTHALHEEMNSFKGRKCLRYKLLWEI